MAPTTKRKRTDRTFSQDGNDNSNRPSPHRPENLGLAQHEQPAGRGGRGGGRGRRGRGANSPTSTQTRSTQPVIRGTSSTNPNPAASTANPTSPLAMSAPVTTNVPTSQGRPQANELTPFSTNKPIIPAEPPSPYVYDYVTDERLASWSTTGKRDLCEQGLESKRSDDHFVVNIIFSELIRATQDGRLAPSDAAMAAKEIVGEGVTHAEDKFAKAFLQCLSIAAEHDRNSAALLPLLVLTEISPELIRKELDAEVLSAVGLVRSTFNQKQVREATSTLYKQANYNLLREETEGFAKLITEFFTTTHTREPTPELAAETYEKVKAFVGAFDLDVGRVLDITLDAFANMLVKHYRFFIKFLTESAWWPSSQPFQGVETLGDLYEPLPIWARPGHQSYITTSDEKEAFVAEKHLADAQFWVKARETGLDAFFDLGEQRRVPEKVRDRLRKESNAAIERDRKRIEKERLEAAKTKKSVSEEEPRDGNSARMWIIETGTVPPRGNSDAAQLLGFKLRFYTEQYRDVADGFPRNIVFLAALLIKVGFISLKDLWPHLYPRDEQMEELKGRRMKEKEEADRKKRGGTLNALALSGALPDDEAPKGASDRLRQANPATSRAGSAKPEDRSGTPASEKEEDIPDQKVDLLRSLLTIGAIPEALYILGKYPWLMEAYPDMPKHVHRILHHMLSYLYDRIAPLSKETEFTVPKEIPVEHRSAPKGTLKLAEPPARPKRRWAQADAKDVDGVDYNFYYEEWADAIPVCRSVEDVFTLCDTFLGISGHKIGEDAPLLLKLIRIGSHALNDDNSEENHKRWQELTKRLLLPAVSLSNGNPCVVHEMFELLKRWPTATRYVLYAEWCTGQTSRMPDIKNAFDLTRFETKKALRLMTRTNARETARLLSKAAYSSPGIVFETAFRQMESYGNFVEVFVECGRYFTFMAYDVLMWSLLRFLGIQNRDSMQGDGMGTSMWLLNLSTFAGRVLRRYAMISPLPILQFIYRQLKQGHAIHLEAFEQIVEYMSGIKSEMRYNEAQTLAMCGGRLLQSRTLLHMQDTRHDSVKSSTRLIRALKEQHLIAPFLIAMAQEKQVYIFRDLDGNPPPPKVLTMNADKINFIFAQYLDMLRSNLSHAEFDANVPNVVSLIVEYGIDPTVAFTICGPSLRELVISKDVPMKNENQRDSRPSAQKRINEDKTSIGVNGKATSESKQPPESAIASPMPESDPNGDHREEVHDGSDEDIEMKDDSTSAAPKPASDTKETSTEIRTATDTADEWQPALHSVIEQFRERLASYEDRAGSLAYYVTFWSLEAHDLLVPQDYYVIESKKVKDDIARTRADRSDLSTLGQKRKEAKVKELNELVDGLNKEMKDHVTYYSSIRNRLAREKNHWFQGKDDSKQQVSALNNALLQDCFLPRMLISSRDAVFCYKMLFYLHSNGVAGFRTMFFLDNLFHKNRLMSIIYQCTNMEASHLGQFLNEVLKELQKWHSDKSTFEKQAYGARKDLPGFAIKFSSLKVPETFREFEDFRRALFKWHRNLKESIEECLKNGEYMHIYNAIAILAAIVNTFPVVNFMGTQITHQVEKLSQEEKRQDLKIAATSLVISLGRRKKEWVLPQSFHINEAANLREMKKDGNVEEPNAETTIAQGASRRVDGVATDATDSNQSNVIRKTSIAGAAEEGEVEDEKTEDADAKIESNAENSQTNQPQSSGNGHGGSDAESKKEIAASPARSSSPMPSRSQNSTTEQHLLERSTATSMPRSTSQERPSTSGPSSRTSTPRADNVRGPPTRAPHGLPDRPEMRRPRELREDHAPRETRSRRSDDSYGRLDRPTDLGRPSTNTPERRQSPSALNRKRPGDEVHATDPKRTERFPGPPLRDDRDRRDDRASRFPPRELRDPGRGPLRHEVLREMRSSEPLNSPRDRPPRSQPSTPSGMAPPGTLASQHDSMARSNGPERARIPDDDHRKSDPSMSNRNAPSTRGHENAPPPHHLTAVNPARAQLIDEPGDGGRGRASANERPGIEHRQEEPRVRMMPDRETQGSQSSHPADAFHGQSQHRERRDDSGRHGPDGPRPSRPLRGGHADRSSRELFDTPTRSGADPSYGRLSQEQSPRYQDPAYGRLNQTPDAPAGPRGRGGQPGRGGRNVPGSQQHGNSQMPSPSLNQNASAQNPHSPRTLRSQRASGQFDTAHTAPQPSSAPPTSGPSGEAGGVHPSRLRNIHPPSIETNNLGFQHGSNAPMSAGPSGTVRNQHIPSGPASAGALEAPQPRNVPTGPASSADRANRRSAQAVQDLDRNVGGQQAEGPFPRGRPNRQAAFASPQSGPPMAGSPSFPRGDDLASQRPLPSEHRHQSNADRTEQGHRFDARTRDREPRGGHSHSMGRNDRQYEERNNARPYGPGHANRRVDQERDNRAPAGHGQYDSRERRDGPPPVSGHPKSGSLRGRPDEMPSRGGRHGPPSRGYHGQGYSGPPIGAAAADAPPSFPQEPRNGDMRTRGGGPGHGGPDYERRGDDTRDQLRREGRKRKSDGMEANAGESKRPRRGEQQDR